jgi:NAD(P)-dependent dehydrogenase (short-subunit alcohol dehydrogenase family)
LYTTKLAMHYLRRRELDPARDRCLIIKSSIAGYLDHPKSPQYCVSKFGGRSLMRCLRRTCWKESIRINVVAPWYIRTLILAGPMGDYLASRGIEFALAEDAAKAVLRIASDQSVNGTLLFLIEIEQNFSVGCRSIFGSRSTKLDPRRLSRLGCG